ncbi:MAG: ion channel [Treponema sp.]|nr:ion channel [Treponema sp.]
MKNKKSVSYTIKKIFNPVIKNPFITTGFFIVVGLFVLAFLIFSFEKDTNSSINSFFDAIWFTLVTITTVGYGDITPSSFVGRIAGLALLLFGVIVFAAFSGNITTFIIDRNQKRDKGLWRLNRMKGHFLICGYKNGFEELLKNVLNSNPELKVDDIVLINEAPGEVERLRSNREFKSINYIAGDFSDEDILKKAKINAAAKALIIYDRSKNYSELEVDSRTVLAVITMKNLNPLIYVAAELYDKKFEKHLDMAHCDEIILTQEYQNNLLSSASNGQGYSNVIRAMIEQDADKGLVVDEVPSDYIGRLYREIKEYAVNVYSDRILVGLLLNTGNFHQRRTDALREAQKNPDVKTIIEDLKKVKTLKSNQVLLCPKDDFTIPKNSKLIFICSNENGEEE